MYNLWIAATIGFIAAWIDVIPMIIQKLDKTSCISAFVHYFVLGLIIPFVHWGVAPWLQGMLISFLTALPVAVMVYSKDRKAIVPILFFSLILGAAIGWAGDWFIQ